MIGIVLISVAMFAIILVLIGYPLALSLNKITLELQQNNRLMNQLLQTKQTNISNQRFEDAFKQQKECAENLHSLLIKNINKQYKKYDKSAKSLNKIPAQLDQFEEILTQQNKNEINPVRNVLKNIKKLKEYYVHLKNDFLNLRSTFEEVRNNSLEINETNSQKMESLITASANETQTQFKYLHSEYLQLYNHRFDTFETESATVFNYILNDTNKSYKIEHASRISTEICDNILSFVGQTKAANKSGGKLMKSNDKFSSLQLINIRFVLKEILYNIVVCALKNTLYNKCQFLWQFIEQFDQNKGAIYEKYREYSVEYSDGSNYTFFIQFISDRLFEIDKMSHQMKDIINEQFQSYISKLSYLCSVRINTFNKQQRQKRQQQEHINESQRIAEYKSMLNGIRDVTTDLQNSDMVTVLRNFDSTVLQNFGK